MQPGLFRVKIISDIPTFSLAMRAECEHIEDIETDGVTQMTTATPTAVYFGKLEDMIAEVSAFDPRQVGVSARECKYLVMPYGAVDFDTEWCCTEADARSIARDVASHYTDCKVIAI